MTLRLQRASDRIVGRLVLGAMPRWVHPNHLAIARLLLCPVVALLYTGGLRWWAVLAFLVAAALDVIDGVLARARNQCTRLGLFLDPLADKLLIGTMLVVAGWDYLVVKVVLVLIAAELAGLVVATFARSRGDLLVPSNLLGKAKMLLQTAAMALLVIGRLVEYGLLADVGAGLLWGALALGLGAAVVSLRAAARRRLPRAAAEDLPDKEPDGDGHSQPTGALH